MAACPRRPAAPLRAPGSHRKAKQQLLTEGVEGLQKRVKKGKGVTKVLVEERQRQVVGGPGAGAVASAADGGAAAACGGSRAWPGQQALRQPAAPSARSPGGWQASRAC